MRAGLVSARHLGALQELGHAAMVQAAAALSRLLGEGVAATGTRAERKDADRLCAALPPCVVIVMQLGGEGGGEIRIAFPARAAERLAARLLGEEGRVLHQESCRSALTEAANIVASSYLNALAAMSGMTLTPSVPRLFSPSDERGLRARSLPFGGVLALESHFSTDPAHPPPIEGDLVLFADAPFVERLLQSSGYL